MRCPICQASVVVRARVGVKASLLRVVALADHIRTLHPSLDKSYAHGDGHLAVWRVVARGIRSADFGVKA